MRNVTMHSSGLLAVSKTLGEQEGANDNVYN